VQSSFAGTRKGFIGVGRKIDDFIQEHETVIIKLQRVRRAECGATLEDEKLTESALAQAN
jgi:hypothetical protein